MAYIPHTVSLEDLQEWKQEAKIMFASSSREPKRLYCKLNGTFQLEYRNQIIWEGTEPHNAVEAYNNPEKILQSKNKQ